MIDSYVGVAVGLADDVALGVRVTVGQRVSVGLRWLAGVLVAVAGRVNVGVDVVVRAGDGKGGAVWAIKAALAEARGEIEGVTEGRFAAASLSECEYP